MNLAKVIEILLVVQTKSVSEHRLTLAKLNAPMEAASLSGKSESNFKLHLPGRAHRTPLRGKQGL